MADIREGSKRRQKKKIEQTSEHGGGNAGFYDLSEKRRISQPPIST